VKKEKIALIAGRGCYVPEIDSEIYSATAAQYCITDKMDTDLSEVQRGQ
jgi:hypothetical protein